MFEGVPGSNLGTVKDQRLDLIALILFHMATD